ncbi:MAG: DNA replication and repair protein RecF [Gemmatimonadetes bacterium]|nr:DNA replication and repair protein RecF [Gemmatimonadota bacterium]
MRLSRLSLMGFRNLEDQALEVPPVGVAIVGPNAQGKTNLLEAIHYLETFRSFRSVRDEQLVRIGWTYFRIEGGIGESRPLRGTEGTPGGFRARVVAAAYDAQTREKRITLDGEVAARIGDAIGAVGSVLFTPDDVRLVSEGPAERRRYLDVLLSLNEPAYLKALQRFRQALARRNAALRRGEGAGSVAAWDEGLVRAGAEVSLGRAQWIERHGQRFSDYYQEASGLGMARMRYESSLLGVGNGGGSHGHGSQPHTLESVEDAYGAALERSREMERRLRSTLIGPHRDEVRFSIDAPEGGRDAREFGSGGERRTIALALRLLEADTVREQRGREPILLLDDLFAELDEDRSRRVLSLLDRLVPGQVILTAPKESDVRFRRRLLPRWRIRGGAVTTS